MTIPPNHRHCNACGGDGRDCQDRRRRCKVCRGKGYWNAEDIRMSMEIQRLHALAGEVEVQLDKLLARR